MRQPRSSKTLGAGAGAWCWRGLADALDPELAELARDTADAHLDASLLYVAGDYMGEHWLATFALLALEPA